MSGFFQFILGFILGLILFSAGIAGGAYWFLTKAAVNPSKPVFEEEKTTATQTEGNSGEENSSTTETTNSNNTSDTLAKSNSESQAENLPAGAYRARVIWNTGLSLRANPSIDAERIGGVGYNWEIIILSLSEDKNWQKIRIPSSGQEGWVKAGNVEKIEN